LLLRDAVYAAAARRDREDLDLDDLAFRKERLELDGL